MSRTQSATVFVPKQLRNSKIKGELPEKGEGIASVKTLPLSSSSYLESEEGDLKESIKTGLSLLLGTHSSAVLLVTCVSSSATGRDLSAKVYRY